MERLIIKNFGPIKEIDIEIKNVNVLIGTTGSGKSTVAKLWGIFRDRNYIDSLFDFRKALWDFNLDFEIHDDTIIQYHDGLEYSEYDHPDGSWTLENREVIDLRGDAVKMRKAVQEMTQTLKDLYPDLFSSLKPLSDEKQAFALEEPQGEYRTLNSGKAGDGSAGERLLDRMRRNLLETKSQYIPAERAIFSMVDESIFGLLNNDVSIPKCIKDFGSRFEIARKSHPNLPIPMLGLTYLYENGSNMIQFEDGATLRMSQTSTGIQSLVPAYVVLYSILMGNGPRNIVVEEPELNLFPIKQKAFLEYLIQVINETNSKLFITTHSPYIISSLDNLIQAQNAFLKHPEKKNEIAKIVPQNLWLDYDNVTSYFFDNGTATSTLKDEFRTIGADAIDDVSEEIGSQFESLIQIEYAE